MRLEHGDILYVENEALGRALYVVARPPVECDFCHFVLRDWEYEEGKHSLYCPRCGTQIKRYTRPVCGRCGQKDQMTLVVAANNSFGLEMRDGVIPYNHRVNVAYTVCEKEVMDDIAHGRIRLCDPVEACQRKRMLLWTSQESYAPDRPMPEWIKERFPMPGEGRA